MVEEQIKVMVERFLMWKLPDDFQPDCGITFVPDYNVGTAYPSRHEPTGTNLLDYKQAMAMVRHMLDGLSDIEAPLRAEIERLRGALENSALWHDDADKTISKQPNANIGQNGWMRAQHREQADAIRQALGDSHV